MKSTRFLIIIPLIFILIIFAAISQFSGASPESTLLKAFTDSGAEIVSSELTFSGNGVHKLETTAELKKFYIAISEAMGANKPITPVSIDNESFRGIELDNANGKYCNYTLKIEWSKEKADFNRCYVTLYILDSSAAPKLTDIKARVQVIFSEFGIKPGVNTCLTGNFPGRLDSNKMNAICSEIFEKTSARKVSGIRENNLISVSAYSRSLKDTVVVDGKDVNLNFAARYNSYENKTYIWLATPLITTEY